MESKKLRNPPFEFVRLHRQIEKWRSTRRHRTRMPDALWRSAANLARQHGVARVARSLRLDYYALKERFDGLDCERIAGAESKPAFIELSPLAATVSEFTVELEHPQGGRMRIQVKGAGVPDLAALSRSFWSVES